MLNTIDSDLIRGHIDTIILKALYEGDRYGFDIIKEVEQKSGGQYIIKQPTLYSCLKRLETQGFIKSYWGTKSIGGRRKYFTLTDLGRELFSKNLSDWEYSRSVIDKLISDGETAFGETSFKADIKEESDKAAASSINADNIDIHTADADEETAAAQTFTYSETLTDSEPAFSAVLTRENYGTGALDQDKLSDDYTNVDYNKDKEETAPIDTDDLMSRLFERNSGDNYISKIVNEHYEPKSAPTAIDPENYFAALPYDDLAEETGTDSDDEDIKNTFDQEDDCSDSLKEQFLSYRSDGRNMSFSEDSDEYIIERDYKRALQKLFKDNVVIAETPKPPTAAAAEQQKIMTERISEKFVTEAVQKKSFEKIASNIKEMGDDVSVRTHNPSEARKYASERYYYSNRLRLYEYGILFILMLVELAICFTAIELGVKSSQPIAKVDLFLYIGAVAVALLFPICAVFISSNDFYKRKRVNFYFKSSLIFRIVVMLQCFVIIYAVNVFFGVISGDITHYLSSLIMPAVMACNFPVSTLIFNALYKSGKFAVR